ncbi:hypothetical protein ABBQ32_009198 [Trebouxia sp. C0010 RCD-2024]
MEPPELPREPHHPPANPPAYDAGLLSTAGMSSSHRTLRSASAGRKPEKANSLLEEFAAEELQTLSKLLPSPAAVPVAQRQPEDERSASPASPRSASTVGSQPTGSEHLSPESIPRSQGRAVSKRHSRHEGMLSEDGLIEDDNSKHVSSTFRGVYKRKYDTKWRAEITAGRRKRCLGSFASEREAAEAGPAAFTNFPANHYASVSTRNEPVKGRAGLGVKDRRFMGVAWCPTTQQFEARIWTRSGEEHELVGMFDTPDAAAHAYDQAALKMHGPEAYTNFLLKPEAGSHRGAGSGCRHTSGRGHAGGEAAGVTVTVRASALNKAPTGKGSSKFRGVSWHKDNMKWRATIFKGSKPVHIGYFDSQQDAARAYDQEAIRLRGPNTSLNFPIADYDVGAPDEEEQDGFSSPLSPSPSPRGLRPEGSFVGESGRVIRGGSSPLGRVLGGPRLDARLVAVFSPRSLPGHASSAGMHTHMESRDHESRAGSESGPRYWAQPLEEAAAPSGAGQPPLGSLADHPLPPPSAPSLQALMKTNPGILKTIQMNEPQPVAGAVSKRGRPLSKPVRGRHAEGAAGGGTSRGRPPLSRQASHLHSDAAHPRGSPSRDAAPSMGASPLDDSPGDVGGATAAADAQFQQPHQAQVDLLAAAAATLAGCKKDKHAMLPIWGHKGRRTQGHDASPCSEDADVDLGMSGEGHMGATWVQPPAEVSGRTLRPRTAKKLRAS